MRTPEEILAKHREYYPANKERLNALRRARRATEKGRAQRREEGRRRYYKHREEIRSERSTPEALAKSQAYYAANGTRSWRGVAITEISSTLMPEPTGRPIWTKCAPRTGQKDSGGVISWPNRNSRRLRLRPPTRVL